MSQYYILHTLIYVTLLHQHTHFSLNPGFLITLNHLRTNTTTMYDLLTSYETRWGINKQIKGLRIKESVVNPSSYQLQNTLRTRLKPRTVGERESVSEWVFIVCLFFPALTLMSHFYTRSNHMWVFWWGQHFSHTHYTVVSR